MTNIKLTWNYRTGAFSIREQKRLMVSPYADTLCAATSTSYGHLWEYNLVGAYGEELIQYKGLQTAQSDHGDYDRRVYIAPYRYIAPGGEVRIKPDNTKEIYITDHLGSVRYILASPSKYFDYDPFGVVTRQDIQLPREGFGSDITDNEEGESNLMQMGVRMYSPQIGRFLSVDPLFEMMPGHNPYHYAFNSPLMFRDPSGMAPVKEKYSEKLQSGFYMTKKYLDSPISIGKEVQIWIDCTWLGFDASSENAKSYMVDGFRNSCGWQSVIMGSTGGSYIGGGAPYYGDPNSKVWGGLTLPHFEGGLFVPGSNGRCNVEDISSNNEKCNGIPKFAFSMVIKSPKNWTADEIDNACEKGGFYNQMDVLSKANNDVETGFFLVYDKIARTLTAQFYIGVSDGRWMPEEYMIYGPPNFPKLNRNQMVNGFTHLHLSTNNFSGGDGISIREFSLGNFNWTKVPNSINNANPQILDKLFFGLVNQNGRSGLSFYNAKTNNNLSALYKLIGQETFHGKYWPPYLDNKLGFEFFKNKKR